jgi:protein-S-isoprenylcysteine O-methyltransferase Ste14
MLLFKNLLFTVVVPGTVGVYLPLMLSSNHSTPPWPIRAVAIALLMVGAAIYGWCVFDFASFGRGTPFPLDSPKKLVRRGLYRYSRNPMYVGVLTVIIGWAVLYRSAAVAAYSIAVALCFSVFVIFFEEPRLRKRFGIEYDQYRKEVPRWLIRL